MHSAGDGKRQRFLERLPLFAERPWTALGLALLISGGAIALRFATDKLLPPGFPYVTFFPAVILISFLLGVRMGALAALICGVVAWYFFIPEFNSFTLHGSGVVALGFYLFVVVTDIFLVHWLQQANKGLAVERELNRSLAETRALLFNELQHRVSNNLQVAAGLLSLQRRGIQDEQAKGALDEASRRLALIGRISRQLYHADGAARSLHEFLKPLCADIVEASGQTGIQCRIEAEQDAAVSPDQAVPLALIVAEAMANAIEHGFAGRETGTIRVSLTRDADGQMQVDVTDDGHGLPDGFDLTKSDSLGLRIAAMLAKQLNGTFELFAASGTTARLVLPA
ncbi:histidine kinase dimerization/phosphoacceptor domain -containing protein [Sphingomonas sp. BGYR3]|uniref:sensor histidine kinase n=1 Tax=Sphingomonas sp. BGYR3 TaxID=2975483 RepID=UPI0021A6DC46|nr:histidine kinase dimerization/phosphoacceptor domain -containing protein [Sphingomonas sp. BGYR3]MDG5488515.1 histidine kinase dimerization/phosphoacceptor domain -containing protein [Sphingomonas sp. BGYR3]